VNQDQVVKLAMDALLLALKVGMPLLLGGLVVGLIVSVFQAVTQIQEMTLSFIPKLLVVAVILVVAGPWMLDQMVGYTADLYHSIPGLVKPR
jgi:flagellar biosynthetic protein FliQ